jgi:phosphoribosylglycinamide formyltransferase-1
MSRLRVGVLISGRGSNLRALLAACADDAYPAEIVSVISDRIEAPGLALAQSAGIHSAVIPHHDRQAFAARAEVVLHDHRVQLVCLAGFMRVLDTVFVDAWRARMINIHPSLLPVFPGLHPQRQALAAGVLHRCTVHFVRPEVDAGPIILSGCAVLMTTRRAVADSGRRASAHPFTSVLIGGRVQIVAARSDRRVAASSRC